MIEFSFKSDKGLVRPINEDNVNITRLASGDIVFMVLDGWEVILKVIKLLN